MSSVLPSGASHSGTGSLSPTWVLAIAGFAAMYLPLYWWAINGIWQTEEQGHGAIILAVMAWLVWSMRHEIDQAPTRPVPALGWPIFGFGLLVYFVGRVFDISILEFGSQPLVVAGGLLLLRGTAAVRVAWFPLLYFIFMIPCLLYTSDAADE